MSFFVDSPTAKALQIAELVAHIQPVSELGVRLQKLEKPFLPGAENALQNEYAVIGKLLALETEKPVTAAQLRQFLQHLEDIHGTVRHVLVHTLEIHEIYEIKH
jgi:hypothetical protein